jgi:hypothetical protein
MEVTDTPKKINVEILPTVSKYGGPDGKDYGPGDQLKIGEDRFRPDFMRKIAPAAAKVTVKLESKPDPKPVLKKALDVKADTKGKESTKSKEAKKSKGKK